LQEAGWDVSVVEKTGVAGGNIRGEKMSGIHYEPHGAHIFHTSNLVAAGVIQKHATLLPYKHVVMTQVNGRTISWPPQVSELKTFAEWPQIEKELDNLPTTPDKTNFETYAISIMGPTLYEWFVFGYTMKQWGRHPSELSASFAPKRIDLRTDGYRGLFRDPVQGWPKDGWITIVDSMLKRVPVQFNDRLTADFVDPAAWNAVIVTAPLDEFLGLDELEWRGVRLEHEWFPDVEETMLPAGVVNQPHEDYAHTRKIETKHMSGQIGERGTVISTEYPGANARHYPVDDTEGNNRRLANTYKDNLRDEMGPHVIPAGRLANYVYIDTDQAIMQGIHAADQAMRGTK
jgi:UDP-galactopyranose mutase